MFLTSLITPLILSAILIAGLRSGVLMKLTVRPLMIVLVGSGIGGIWKALSLPGLPDPVLAVIAEMLLGALVFMAAMECRVSRIYRTSPEAFRLATAGTLIMMFGYAMTAFAVMAELEIASPILTGLVLAMGGAPVMASILLAAPIEDKTKKAARLEASTVLVLVTPVFLLIGTSTQNIPPGNHLWQFPMFSAVIGFAFGAVTGLIASRFLKLQDSELPLAPLIVGAAVGIVASLLGWSPVMAMAGAGIALSEQLSLNPSLRTRYWRTGEALLAPIALLLFALTIGPMAITFDLLIWFMALVGVFAVKVIARQIALAGCRIDPADRTFLVLFNGAPGIVSALLLVLFSSYRLPLDEKALSLAAAAIIIGVASTRAASRPLTRRLVQQTAIARKPRYKAA